MPTITELFSDDFSGYGGGAITAPYTGNLASTSTTGNQLAFTTANQYIARETNYADLRFLGTWTPGATSKAIVFFRAWEGNIDTAGIAVILNADTDAVRIFWNGVPESGLVNIGTTNSFTFTSGQAYTVQVDLQKNNIVVRIDGAVVAAGQTTFGQTSTQFGFKADTGSDLNDRWSSYTISRISDIYETMSESPPVFTKYVSNPIFNAGADPNLDGLLWWTCKHSIRDLHLDELSVTPLDNYYIYAGSDHSSDVVGAIYLYTAPSPLGPFTFRQAVHSDDSSGFLSTETPEVIWDDDNNRIVLLYHSRTTNEGDRQKTFWASSTNGTTFTGKNQLAIPTNDDGLTSPRSYGHTGYARIIAKFSDGFWYAWSTVGSTAGGNGGNLDSARVGIYRSASLTGPYALYSESIVGWLPKNNIGGGNHPFILNGRPMIGSSQTTNIRGQQFSPVSTLRIGELTSSLDGVKAGWVEAFTVGTGTADGQAWESSSANLRWHGFCIEPGASTDTLYGYYSISRSIQGVATAAIPKQSFDLATSVLPRKQPRSQSWGALI